MSECVENGTETTILSKETPSAGEHQDAKCNLDQDTTKMNGIVSHDEDSQGKEKTDEKKASPVHVNGGTEKDASDTEVTASEIKVKEVAIDVSQNGEKVVNMEVSQGDDDHTAKYDDGNAESKSEVQNDSNKTEKQIKAESNDDDNKAACLKEDSSSSESSVKLELVGTVKDDDGEDILITLNEEEDTEKADKETDDDNALEVKSGLTQVGKSDSAERHSDKIDVKPQTSSAPSVGANSQPQKPDAAPSPKASVATSAVVSLPIVSLPLPTLPQSSAAGLQPSPAASVIQQGQQFGYVAKIGNQNVFVPISTAAVSHPGIASQLGQTGKQATAGTAKVSPLEEMEVKSSKDMINLMKWEIQNRIPDNYNWSVAFHPKKDELSSVTSFLLDLGHDVVKEAVYKDIIQIQTKKKENDELKENEIESLDKMKTVYDNTKKKVRHLQLPSKSCKGCNFKTESSVVMQHHLTFPHFDPWWDTVHGFMCCTQCSFRTKVILQFDIHMDTMHGVKARFLDKLNYFQCELCPLNTTTKNKLEKHRQKCIKHFKLNVNLQPYFHDINFVMKNAFYKPKKVVVKPPATPLKPGTGRQTRQSFPNQSTQLMLQQHLPKQALGNQRPPPLQQRPQLAGVQGGQFRGPTVRQSPPALQARPQLPQRPLRPQNKEMAGFEVCELCGGYVKDRQALRIHFYYAHKVEMPQAIFTRPQAPLNCDVCQSKFWTTQGLSKHKSTQRHFGSSPSPVVQGVTSSPGANQKCFMCMRKVPSLFIHIEQVHGMTMKELVAMKKCIMCGITAPDRRQLEVHMATQHGVLIKANDYVDTPTTVAPTSSPAAVAAAGPKASVAAPPPPPARRGPPGMPMHQQSTVTTLQDKGVKPVGRLNLCVFCQIQFADNIQLTMHCIKIHATCTGCGMVVATSKHLQGHNCKQVKRDCVICGAKNVSPETYAEHMKKHVKPCKVKLDKLTQKEITDVKTKIKREYKPQVISLDSDEDSEVEVVDPKSEDAGIVKDKAGRKNDEKTEEEENSESENGAKSDDEGKEEKENIEESVAAEKETPDAGSCNGESVQSEDSESNKSKTNGELVNNAGSPAIAEDGSGTKRKVDEIETSDDGVEAKRRKDEEEESLNDIGDTSEGVESAQDRRKGVKRDLEPEECAADVPVKQAKMDTTD